EVAVALGARLVVALGVDHALDLYGCPGGEAVRLQSIHDALQRQPRAHGYLGAVHADVVDDAGRQSRTMRDADERVEVRPLVDVAERGLAPVVPPRDLGRAAHVEQEHQIGHRRTERQGTLELGAAQVLPEHEAVRADAFGSDDVDALEVDHDASPPIAQAIDRPVMIEACSSDPTTSTFPSSTSCRKIDDPPNADCSAL